MKKTTELSYFVLVMILLISFDSSKNLINNLNFEQRKPNNSFIFDKEPFIIGTGGGLSDLDPQDADDYSSYNVIDQVCEGLFAYNLSDPNMAPIPNLATGYGTWSGDGKNWTLPLRTGVIFHDGTLFNATAVKWTFDRLFYLTNQTGDLPGTETRSHIYEYYEHVDGTPIINKVEVVSEHTIKFVLNKPFIAFQGLLCFSGSYILSPSSTPFDRFLDRTDPNDLLVGTGPFVYDHYIPNVEVKLHAYENYWKGKADFDDVYFSIIDEPSIRNNAMLNGSIHFLDGISGNYFDAFKADPNITFVQDITGAGISYLSMNNKVVNSTWRKAISHAINYTYLIKDYWQDQMVRLKSPIPAGILFSNYSLDYPIFNVTHARKIIKDDIGPVNSIVAGLPNGADPAADAAAWEAITLVTFNYSYYFSEQFRTNLLPLLQDWLGKIGIEVLDGGADWAYFLYRAYGYIPGGYDAFEIFWMSKGIRFNDPSEYVNALFSNASLYNNAQVNDPYLENLLTQGLEETDPNVRKQIYNEIQRYLVEDLMPIALGYTAKRVNVYHKDLTGFKQSALYRIFLYPCSWNRSVNYSYYIEMTSAPDITYTEGSTGNHINWTIAAYNESNPLYFVYRNTTLIKNDAWASGDSIVINVDNLTASVYEYKIEVHNEQEIEDDTVIVTVNAQTPDDNGSGNGTGEIPGYDIGILFGISLIFVYFIRKVTKGKTRIL